MLMFSTYLGGVGIDSGYAVGCHPITGVVYVGFQTQDAGVSVIGNPYRNYSSGGRDAVIFGFNFTSDYTNGSLFFPFTPKLLHSTALILEEKKMTMQNLSTLQIVDN